METNTSLNIVELWYKRTHSEMWEQYPITPEDYFEDSDEVLHWDDLPRHAHADAYLPLNPNEIAQTRVVLYDKKGKPRIETLEILWQEGQCRHIKQIEDNWCIEIVQILIQEEPKIWHTVRLTHQPNGSGLLEHLTLREEKGKPPEPECIISRSL